MNEIKDGELQAQAFESETMQEEWCNRPLHLAVLTSKPTCYVWSRTTEDDIRLILGGTEERESPPGAD